MRIQMINDRDFTPPEERRVTVSYPVGGEFTVKRAWGEAMVAAGDATEIPAPPKAEDA